MLHHCRYNGMTKIQAAHKVGLKLSPMIIK
jgi:hypothetical protein